MPAALTVWYTGYTKRINTEEVVYVKDDSVKLEAEILGQYLLGQTPHQAATDIYYRAITADPGVATKRDKRLLAFLRRHPRSVGLIDAGLSLINHDSEVRRRIHLMFSILESMPEYHDKFLSKERNRWYVLVIGAKGVLGGFKTLIGSIFVKVIS